MDKLLEDLSQLEQIIEKFAILDDENYQKYLNAISEIKEELFELDDEQSSMNELMEIINKIVELEIKINEFLEHGENGETRTLSLSSNNAISGKEKIKRYKINLFISILKNLRKTPNIDITKLKELRKKWLQEKEDNKIQYSPIEIDKVEEEFAQTVLEYQIKHLEEYRTSNTELLEFCNSDKLEKKLRERLFDIIQSKEKNTTERLDLEFLYTTAKGSEILYNKKLWEAISGVEIAGIEHNNNVIEIKPGRVVVTFQFYTKFSRREKTVKKEFRVKNGKISIPSKNKNRIKSILIEGGITLIPEGTFNGCERLQTVDMSKSRVKEIGERAFEGCKCLCQLYLPESLEKIGKNAFKETDIEKLALHKNVRSIGESAFMDCYRLTTVDMSETAVKIIGRASFSGCRSLEKLYLPENITTIDMLAFRDCESLTTVDMSKTAVKIIGDASFRGCTSLGEIYLPETLKIIGESAFAGTEIAELKLPESVTSIESYAFHMCGYLRKINWPKYLEKIGGSCISRNKNNRT